MRVLAKRFAVALTVLLFLLLTAPSTSNTAEMESPTNHSDDLAPSPPVNSSFSKTCSLYSLFYTNCDPQISSVYFAFSIIYLSFVVYWISVSLKIKPFFRRIHLLMGALILMKALTLIDAATGTHGSGIFFYISKSIMIVRLLIVLNLIASGWYFMEPIMEKVDKVALMALIPLQLSADIVRILMGETGYIFSDWLSGNDLLVAITLNTCCVMIIAMFWWLKSPITGGVGARSYPMFTKVRTFYTAVMLYLLFQSSVVIRARENGDVGLDSIEAQQYLWKSTVVFEMYSLNFYMIIFRLFKQHFAVLASK